MGKCRRLPRHTAEAAGTTVAFLGIVHGMPRHVKVVPAECREKRQIIVWHDDHPAYLVIVCMLKAGAIETLLYGCVASTLSAKHLLRQAPNGAPDARASKRLFADEGGALICGGGDAQK